MQTTDIRDRADIELLINTFYDKVRENQRIGYIFNDVAKVDWDAHLPVMYDFWETNLFGTQRYSGNPMTKHLALSRQTALTEEHFNEWLRLFTDTVDALFSGETADDAKFRAGNIARLMLYKIEVQKTTS